MTRLIAIAGKDGSGKSTFAGKLATRLGDAYVCAVATGLREHCISEGYLTRQQAYAKPTSQETRNVLRNISKEAKVKYGTKLIWLNKLLLKMRGFLQVCPVIVHDVRYLHEAETLLSLGAELIYLGGCELSAEECGMPSFADLPALYELAKFKLPEKPDDKYIAMVYNSIIETRLHHE